MGGLKLITTRAGMVPDATIRYVPADVLDPHQNGGQTLLYYTGITRLAKNILQQVVGRYLDRDREAVRVLRDLREIAPQVAESLARKDLAEFGQLIDQVWEVEQTARSRFLERADRRHARSRAAMDPWCQAVGGRRRGLPVVDLQAVRKMLTVTDELQDHPPNERARFFDFAVSRQGLGVSVC